MKRTPRDDFRGKWELAVLLAWLPEARDRAVRLLRDAVEGLRRFPKAEVLLGILLEAHDGEAARMHIERARRHWTLSRDFDEYVESTRRDLGLL